MVVLAHGCYKATKIHRLFAVGFCALLSTVMLAGCGAGPFAEAQEVTPEPVYYVTRYSKNHWDYICYDHAFDQYGRLVSYKERAERPQNSPVTVHTITYSDLGVRRTCSEVTTYAWGGSYRDEIIVTYDGQGNEVSKSTASGTVLEVTSNRYNGNQLDEKLVENAQTGTSTFIDYLYNPDGRVRGWIETHSEDEGALHVVCEYDQNGNLVREVAGDGEPFEIATYEYELYTPQG